MARLVARRYPRRPHRGDTQVTRDKLPGAMGAEEDSDYVRGYMDMIDWECELGCASSGNRIFPSVEDLRELKKCCRNGGCGIVEVEVRVVRVVEEQDLSAGIIE